MGGKTDVVKGRIKEAAGALTGNDELRDEGKTDQVVGKAEQAVQTKVRLTNRGRRRLTAGGLHDGIDDRTTARARRPHFEES